jgi:hypothetical protein
MRIDSSGNLLVGTTTGSTSRLIVTGSGSVDMFTFTGGSAGTNYGVFRNQAGTAYGIIGGGGGGALSGGATTDFTIRSENNLLFAIGNTERARIDSSGNVGIGTTTPASRLNVSGTTGFTWSGGGTSSGLVTIGTQGTGGSLFVNTASLNSSFASGLAVDGTYSNPSAVVNLKAVGVNSGGSYNASLAFFTSFETTLSEKMRITSDGNVGIGRGDPPAALSIWRNSSTASVAASSSIVLTNKNTSINGTIAGGIFIDTYRDIADPHYTGGIWFTRTQTSGNLASGSDIVFGAQTNNSSSALPIERMRIDSGGGVGIGTAAVDSRLHVELTGVAGMRIGYGGLSSNYFDANANIFRLGNATETMRINSDGNLLVGTTSNPESSRAVFSGSSQATMTCITDTTSTSNQIIFRNPNGAVGAIFTSGTATTYSTSSDYRLKEIDGPIVNSGAYIDALKPVQGSWKADGSRFIGLLAHEVQEVSETPIATGEKDGEKMQAMDYSAPELIANLIAEIQSLRARVAQLEGTE